MWHNMGETLKNNFFFFFHMFYCVDCHVIKKIIAEVLFFIFNDSAE
jgi:hypothetical protein